MRKVRGFFDDEKGDRSNNHEWSGENERNHVEVVEPRLKLHNCKKYYQLHKKKEIISD